MKQLAEKDFWCCTENFPAQEEIFNHPARFKVVPKGRRFGMTRGKAHHLMRSAMKGKFRKALWVDYSYDNLNRYYMQYFLPCLRFLNRDEYKYHKTDSYLQIGEAMIDFRSATNPFSIEGFAYDDVFLNEAGIILQNDYLWDHAIRPMLMDYKSPALIAGTPKGYNRFEKLYNQALTYARDTPEGSEYKVFYRPTFLNPHIDRSEIEQMLRSSDSLTSLQEIYGLFTDATGRTFAHAFDGDRHVGKFEYETGYPIFLSFDFNVSPMTAIAAQHFDGKIRIRAEFRQLHSDVFKFAGLIKEKLYPYFQSYSHDTPVVSDRAASRSGFVPTEEPMNYPAVYLTGDASGQNRSALTADGGNFFTILLRELNLPAHRLIIPKANPPHTSNRELVNAILERHPDFLIHSDCRFLIEDLKSVRVTDTGKIDKSENPLQSHLLDCLRYYLNTFHADFCRRYFRE